MHPRKAEFVLILIAGITGVIAGFAGIIGCGFMSVLVSYFADLASGVDIYTSMIDTLISYNRIMVVIATLALIIGVALFVFAFLIKNNAKVFGSLTLTLGVVGFFLTWCLWIVPGILAIIAGIMCLARKPDF
ncbi:DUF4064 domain-containing protein [Listeria seeligeri]|uniref:DUF4064 domain-containing protein n=1 Tax=Listeria seeligeri TaxID=1640 RepID=UPI0022EBB759|nr:DUF4064 domain-containing protein [Listeria seeligeri]